MPRDDRVIDLAEAGFAPLVGGPDGLGADDRHGTHGAGTLGMVGDETWSQRAPTGGPRLMSRRVNRPAERVAARQLRLVGRQSDTLHTRTEDGATIFHAAYLAVMWDTYASLSR